MPLIRGFLSYSHIDSSIRNAIADQLEPLKKAIGLEIWADTKLTGGDEFTTIILQQMRVSETILVLISPDFLKSTYCMNIEMAEALRLHREQRARTIPILIRNIPESQAAAEILKLEALPKMPRALDQWADQQAGYTAVTTGVRDAVQSFRQERMENRRRTILSLAQEGKLESACNLLMDFAGQFSDDPQGDSIKATALKSVLMENLRTPPKDLKSRTALYIQFQTMIRDVLDGTAPGEKADQGRQKTEPIAPRGFFDELGRLTRIATHHPIVSSPPRPPRKNVNPGELGILIEADHIKKNYSKFSFCMSAKDLQIQAGTITGLVGSNGSGKTTLLKILSGLLAPDKGTVRWPGFGAGKPHWTTIRRQVKYLPQEIHMADGMAINAIRLNAVLSGIYGSRIDFKIEELLTRLGINHFQNAHWSELSGGYKLKFALAAMLICQPKVLFLDEPLANLDLIHQKILLTDLEALARNIKQPVAIVLSSQSLAEVEAVADNMILMSAGEAVYDGPVNGIGMSRTVNTFQFRTPLGRDELATKLLDFTHYTLEEDALGFTMTTPTSTKLEELFHCLVSKEIPITSISDESRSIKTIFTAKTANNGLLLPPEEQPDPDRTTDLA